MTTPDPHTATGGPQGPRRITRSREDRMIAGVCAGVADYLGLDVNLVRLLTVVGAILGVGTLVVAYVVAWILIPERRRVSGSADGGRASRASEE